MFDIEELKESLGDTTLLEGVSDSTLIKLKLMAENLVTAKTKELKEEVEKRDAKIELITEKAEEYAKKILEDYIAEHKDTYSNLTEKAQAYGDYCAEQATKELSEKVEEYAQYVVEEFIKENQHKFVESKEYNRMKAVFESVKDVFEENMYPLVENSKTSELQDKLDEATSQYTKLFKENKTLKEYAKYVEKQMILDEKASGLSDSQKEKISKLTESFKDINQFKQAVDVLVEDYKTKQTSQDTEIKSKFTTTPVTQSSLTENVNRESFTDKMSSYLKTLSNQ